MAGQCSDEDVFSTYATDADTASQVELGRGVVNMLVGPNWIINIPEQHRAALQAKIGGEHVPGELDLDDEPSNPIRGTFTVDLEADTVEGQDEETARTPRSSSKLRIVVADVEYYE